ncbi:hypothetical protein BCR34DRAFT_586038 [Clohesyomyces aquaticus]|uniref:Uncharacterized protein n=1 Tax=Clohesyomyces aquaticus TaxID=1231657 RepID=A0A1Y1ZVB3_9PLEO|nr:hypothetical protein BCR34DRAFT_586038 [Clohesyomyces aquaticus]
MNIRDNGEWGLGLTPPRRKRKLESRSRNKQNRYIDDILGLADGTWMTAGSIEMVFLCLMAGRGVILEWVGPALAQLFENTSDPIELFSANSVWGRAAKDMQFAVTFNVTDDTNTGIGKDTFMGSHWVTATIYSNGLIIIHDSLNGYAARRRNSIIRTILDKSAIACSKAVWGLATRTGRLPKMQTRPYSPISGNEGRMPQ